MLRDGIPELATQPPSPSRDRVILVSYTRASFSRSASVRKSLIFMPLLAQCWRSSRWRALGTFVANTTSTSFPRVRPMVERLRR